MTPITVAGTLQADGVTLQLEQRVALPPGRVTVTMQPLTPGTGPTMVEVLERIHREQQQSGRNLMTEAEMNAEIAQQRVDDEEYEARCREIRDRTQNQGG